MPTNTPEGPRPTSPRYSALTHFTQTTLTCNQGALQLLPGCLQPSIWARAQRVAVKSKPTARAPSGSVSLREHLSTANSAASSAPHPSPLANCISLTSVNTVCSSSPAPANAWRYGNVRDNLSPSQWGRATGATGRACPVLQKQQRRVAFPTSANVAGSRHWCVPCSASSSSVSASVPRLLSLSNP